MNDTQEAQDLINDCGEYDNADHNLSDCLARQKVKEGRNSPFIFYRIFNRSTGLIVQTLFKSKVEAKKIMKLYETIDTYKESLLEIQEVIK